MRIASWVAMLCVACLAMSAAADDLGFPLEILKPDGGGPFPAVVMLHDCSGLGPRSRGAPRRWAKELLAHGYVVAIPDSFSTRGFPNGTCTDPSPKRVEVGPFKRVEDAYRTLEHLRALPYVKGDRIGVMGGSHGGSTTLATIATGPRDSKPERKKHGFAAAVALYPGCDIGKPAFDKWYQTLTPLLILSGELDDWTPAKPCEALVESAKAHGSDATIKVYPGAHHSFDNDKPERYVATRNNAHAILGKGATTGGNPAAWKDSIVQVDAFFARHLGDRP